MEASANSLVQDVQGLITLPDVYLRINRLVEDADSSTEDIARAAAQDPSFAMRLLRIANSALYRRGAGVDTVARAVSMIGTSQVRNLALSMSVASSFAGLPNDLVTPENFWRHSLLCALAARHLARRAGRCDPDALFTAGLLHDIGELIIFNRMPDKARESLESVLDSQDQTPIYAAEQEAMGFDHGEVGGELARQWKLPPLLQECIACHHDIAAATRHPREAALVHIANILAQLAEIDSLDLADVPEIDPHAWALTGLAADCIEETVREAQAGIDEAVKLFTAGS